MKTTLRDNEKGYRFFVIKTAVGTGLWRVRLEDLATFAEILGDMIEGAGDTREEAIRDYEGRMERKGERQKQNEERQTAKQNRVKRWWRPGRY